MNRMKIGQLNINSIRNLLVPAVVRNLDVLLISETKIDTSFPKLNLRLMILLLHTELVEIVMGEEVYYYK